MDKKTFGRCLLLGLYLAVILHNQVIAFASTANVTDITEDGYVQLLGAAYIKFNNSANDIATGQVIPGSYYQGYIEFNISSIPDDAIIDAVYYRYYLFESDITTTTYLRQFDAQPSVLSNQSIYQHSGNDTIYFTDPYDLAINNWYMVKLDTAENDLDVTLDYFAIGFDYVGGGSDVGKIRDAESAQPSQLLVYYHQPTDYAFTLSDAYYENGTLATVTTVTASDSFSDTFNTSGGVTKYYPSMPSHFSWDIGDGITRTIHVIEEENLTITIPDGTDYVYSFTIRDYTGKTGEGQSYLEAWRVVSGVETLIERMPINQPNTVPLNLVYGKTYRLKILYSDGTRYDWGYFVAGATSSLTLTIRATSFSDQLQILYNHISVEATRNGAGTIITIDYEDTLNNTIWANVTITVRGGAVVLTASRDNSTYTINWASANASLGYIVTVQGLHGDYGAWSYSKILDQSETFADAPDLTGIFDFGLTGDIGAWVISLLVIITFSKVLKTRAVIAGVATMTLLRYIGWSTSPWSYFYGYWFIAILIAAGTGGGE